MRQRNVKNKMEIIANSSFVIQNAEEMIGNWSKVFSNNQPIYLEIGMGKGDFIIENAKRYPNINFIGIEKSASILALAIKKMDGLDLDNLRLIHLDAMDISKVFHHEIDKIFLNFSDPWPKERHEKRRLTSSTFIQKYDDIFKNNKIIEMKTDNQKLFEYSLISLNKNAYRITEISLDLHHSDIPYNIMTEYEKKFSSQNNNIYYVKVEK